MVLVSPSSLASPTLGPFRSNVFLPELLIFINVNSCAVDPHAYRKGVYLQEVASLDHEILDDSVKCAVLVSLWHTVLLVFSCAQLSIQ